MRARNAKRPTNSQTNYSSSPHFNPRASCRLNERLGKREELPQTFVVQLVQRLREQHPSVMPVMDWIEKQLAKQGTSIEQIIHAEHQRQAAAQVTVGNIITSMRLLSTLDWNDFFEKVSLIEPLLGRDPAGVYSRMEFASRDRYRHVIERISKANANKRTRNRGSSRQARGANKGRVRPEKTRRLFPHRRRFSSSRKQLWLSTAAHRTFASLSAATFHRGIPRHTHVSDPADHESAALYDVCHGAGWQLLVVTALLALIPASDLA